MPKSHSHHGARSIARRRSASSTAPASAVSPTPRHAPSAAASALTGSLLAAIVSKRLRASAVSPSAAARFSNSAASSLSRRSSSSKASPALLGGHARGGQRRTHRTAMRQAHAHIGGLQAQSLHGQHRAADHLGVCGGAFHAHQVYVPLHELAQATALLTLGAEVHRNGEPLHRHRQAAGLRRNHSRQRGRELGAQRVVVVATRAAETEQLVHDARAALGGVQRQVLVGGAFDLVEAAVHAGLAPRALDVTAHRHRVGIEVARALGGPGG